MQVSAQVPVEANPVIADGKGDDPGRRYRGDAFEPKGDVPTPLL